MALKDAVETLKNAVEIGAIFVGGWWTWHLFIKQRVGEQKAHVAHAVSLFGLHPGHVHLRVVVSLANDGTVSITPPRFNTTLQQLSPLSMDLAARLSRGERLVAPGDHEVEWPLVEDYDISLSGEDWTVEPGESEKLYLDFVVPTSVQLVQIHTRIFDSSDADARYWEDAVVISTEVPTR